MMDVRRPVKAVPRVRARWRVGERRICDELNCDKERGRGGRGLAALGEDEPRISWLQQWRSLQR